MTTQKGFSMTRRNFLTTGGCLVAGAIPGFSTLFAGENPGRIPDKATCKRVLRFAHFTDIHLRDDYGAAQGLAAALNHMQNLHDKPGLLITGGDMINNRSKSADVELRLLKKVFHEECSLPVKHCLGNHDMCDWPTTESHQAGPDRFWKKERPVQELAMPHRFYSFDQSGWHFIILDSMGRYPEKDVYYGCLDPEQFQWLEQDLKNTPSTTPIIVVSHIAILSAAVFELAKIVGEQICVDNCEMHTDSKEIRNLFRQHPNVKLCLSGHLHLYDRVDYDGITYICDGAVCGGWWLGNFHNTEAGYGIVDLYRDGTFSHQYQPYGWKPIAPTSKD